MYCEKCGCEISDKANFCGECGRKVLREKLRDKSNTNSHVNSEEPEKSDQKPSVRGAVAVFGFIVFVSIPFFLIALITEFLALGAFDLGAVEEVISGFTFFIVAELVSLTFWLFYLGYSLYLVCKLSKKLPQIFPILGVLLILIDTVGLTALYSLSSSAPEGLGVINELQLEAAMNPLGTLLYVVFWSLVLRYTKSAKNNLVK